MCLRIPLTQIITSGSDSSSKAPVNPGKLEENFRLRGALQFTYYWKKSE